MSKNNNSSDGKEDKGKNKTAKYVIIAAIVFIVIVIAASAGGNKTENQTNESSNTTDSISEHDAEVFCQDAAILGKYLDLDKTSIIKATNYGKSYTPTDTDQEHSGILLWNGEDKTTNEQLRFDCELSRQEDGTLRLDALLVNAVVIVDINGKYSTGE